MLREHGGRLPGLEARKAVASKLGIDQLKVYKWFWEVTTLRSATKRCKVPPLSSLSLEQLYSVPVNPVLNRKYSRQVTVTGRTASGEPLSEDEIMTSLMRYQKS